VFPTNDLALPPPTIARLYKCRWQVALFFKWIKRHPRIKRFFGTAENAAKTRVRIAISVYVLIAIIKKRRDIDASLDTTLPVPSVTAFEKTLLRQMLRAGPEQTASKERESPQVAKGDSSYGLG